MILENNSDALNGGIIFADETSAQIRTEREPWKLLIVDDEEVIHRITRMALEGFVFEDRSLVFYSAYSAKEARALLQEHPDAALILLDVVMETDYAGLELVRYIRTKLCNSFIRIILRTGRPGQAPERRVITEYDINDYKEKTELTVQKLTTTIITALRSYRDLRIIDRTRKGLLNIINASAHLFEIRSLKQFANGVLTQLLSILNLDENSLYLYAGFSASSHDEEFLILAATGKFESLIDQTVNQVMPPEITARLTEAVTVRSSLFFDGAYVGYYPTGSGRTGLLYLSNYGSVPIEDLDRDLIRLFSTNVSIAFKNLDLNSEIIDTQKEVIITLGEIVENRSQGLANHCKRVAEVSYLLAKKAGLDETQAEILRLASPMHDIGKVGVPDAVLFKPAKFTLEEFEQIKPHSEIGFEILRKSGREIMEAAALIAMQHHERWDGNGYPSGIAGEDIHIFARITGLADVFDALSHHRVYKAAWEMIEVAALIRDERGKHFDPHLADIFLEHLDEFIAINDLHPAF